MSDRDDYVKVPGVARKVTEAAVMFSIGDSVPRAAWIPRSCIHGGDDLTLKARADEINRSKGGIVLTLQIRRWKADQIGFAGDRDGATDDLFAGGGA